MQVSRRYRYVEDYRTVPVMDEKGKVQQKALYTGEWVCLLADDAAYASFLRQVRLLTAAAAAGIVAALAVNHSAYEVMYVSVPLVMALFPLAYLIMGACSLQKKAVPMEKLQYIKGLQRVSHSAMGVLVMSIIVLLGKAVFRVLCMFGVLKGFGFVIADAVFLAGIAAAVLSAAVIKKRCTAMKTELRPNDAYSAKPR